MTRLARLNYHLRPDWPVNHYFYQLEYMLAGPGKFHRHLYFGALALPDWQNQPVGGLGGTVLTLSSTSEVGGSNPEPYVGKLVAAYRWLAVNSKEP